MRYTTDDIREMIAILPDDFIENTILRELNRETSGYKEEDKRMFNVAKTFTDAFVDEVLSHNKAEYDSFNRETNESKICADDRIAESYKRLINPNISKEDEKRVIEIGSRVYTWKYAQEIQNIDRQFILEVYLCALLDDISEEARETAEMFLYD